MGQLIDLLTAPEDCVDLNRFSLDRYLKIVEYKTAYYSFYLPVALALLLSGVTHKSAFKVANDILIPLGVFFQIQDDYLDCFGDPETIGKIGTDIQDNKCSWLVVQALERVTPEQRQLLEQNYGQKDMDKVNTVKQLYRDLNLEQVYRNYEEASYKDMETKINKIDEQVLNKEIFHRFAKKIYKRNK
jgi:farnesyl diphosphate synthase